MGLFEEYRPDAHGVPLGSGLRIRPATGADLERVAALSAERNGLSLADAGAGVERTLERSARGLAALFVAEQESAGAGPPGLLGYGQAHWLARPEGAPPNWLPEGWYLSGVVVAQASRRRGVGLALTRARLAWVARRATRVRYFASAANRTSLALHAPLGFVEETRDFQGDGLSFTGSVGILFVADLTANGR